MYDVYAAKWGGSELFCQVNNNKKHIIVGLGDEMQI